MYVCYFFCPPIQSQKRRGEGGQTICLSLGDKHFPHMGGGRQIFYVGGGSGYDDAEMKGPEIPVYFSITLQIRIDFT